MNSVRTHPRLRLWSSRLSSLLLLVQRSPIIQLIFPEAKILGGSAIADSAVIAITTIVGLGAYDSVAGATMVLQVLPLPGTTTAPAPSVPAAVGSNLNFVYKNSNSETPGSYQITSGTLPAGLTKGTTITSKTQTISGIPTQPGATAITLKAWEFSNNTGLNTSGTFTIYVLGYTTQPAATKTINSGSTTSLTCAVTGAATGATLAYQWYQGASGTTTSPVAGATSATFTTPALTAATNYWVKVTSTLSTSTVSVNSTTSAISVTGTVPAGIASQPLSNIVNFGGTVTLSMTANGSLPLTYQWYQGLSGDTSIPIAGSNSPSYTTPALTANTSYWVRVTNTTTKLNTADSFTATVTVRNQFDSWMAAPANSGVPGNLNGPWDMPFGDGIPSILKYAFNLNPNIADIRRLSVGAGNTAGLPGTSLVSSKLRLEFIRRKAATTPGITYTPQFGSTPGAWTDAASPTPTSIDTTWERVVVDDPAPTGGRRFGRVAVTQLP